MHWSTEPFIEFREVLELDDQATPLAVQQLFDNVLDDLKGFLNTPTRSDTSRKKLESGKIALEGVDYEVNREFIEVACTLADELGIDELIAAELIQSSSSDNARLDMTPIQGGVAMFYVRRQHILNFVQFFLHTTCDPGAVLASQCKNFLLKLENLLQKTLDGMKAVENSFVDLEEKEKRAQFLGQLQNAQFVQLLQLRRDFLVQEHDTLGQILCGLVENKITTDEFFKILDAAQVQTAYNSIFIHYLAPIFIYSTSLDAQLTMTTLYKTSAQDAKTIQKKLMDKKEWKLPYGRGCVELVFNSFFAGMCRDESVQAVDYNRDILDPVRRAIDDGALELLLAIAADTGSSRLAQKFDFRSILQYRVPRTEIKISDAFLAYLTVSLERIAESIVGNLADILKEMRLAEEDSHLAQGEDDSGDAPGNDLERFYIFVSYLYDGRPRATEQFWADTEGNLYGFMQWASAGQVMFISAAFCDMLASLASGAESAKAVHRFLREPTQAKSGRKTAKINWEYIFTALKYYGDQLVPETAQQPPTIGGSARVAISAKDIQLLNDDTLIILFSYLRLISNVVQYDSGARSEILGIEINVLKLLFNLLITQNPLISSVFQVISSFALTDNNKTLAELWEALDNWAFNTEIYSPDGGVITKSMPAKDRLYNLMTDFDDAYGLVHLLESLMKPPPTEDLYSLPFPDDLGGKYRTPGVWPYVDYLIGEVFHKSAATEFTQAERLTLQLPCLMFIKRSLQLFDPDIARLAVTAGVNPDQTVKSQSFLSYLRMHPCGSTMTHLFSDRIYNLLVAIASAGIDVLGQKKCDDPSVQVVEASIDVINLTLDLQSTFVDIIVNEFKFGDGGPQFSTHGLKSFEDALLFNLPIVSHLALYVGLPNLKLAHSALQLLDRLAASPQFATSSGSTKDSRIKKNRLLSALETVDESVRIKEGFIEQLERDIDQYEEETAELDGVAIKLELLNFLISSLRLTSKEPTIAHFFLGFKANTDGSLSLDTERGGVSSEISLLQSILSMLDYATQAMEPRAIELKSSQIASACSEIILLLVENNNSCLLVLEYLRENDFMLTALQRESVIDSRALWNGERIQQNADAFLNSDSADTVVSFFTHRMAMLEYMSVETHVSAGNGALSLVSRYLHALVNLDLSRTFHSARVLSFLDVLEFQIDDNLTNDAPSVDVFGQQVVQHFYEQDNDGQDIESAIAELKHLLRLKGLEFIAQQKLPSLEDADYVAATNAIVATYSRVKMAQKIRHAQLACLISWCRLIQVLVNDTELAPAERSTFILETFQSIIPKLSDYASRDVEFSEQLASLIVSLYKIYQSDIKQIGKGQSDYDRTHSLFKAALISMQTPLSTPDLRADLYVICYQYLKACIGSPQLVKQIVQTIRGSGDKLLETICNDAISSEGLPRLTALVFLEVLGMVATEAKSTFVLDGLVRYNLLLLLTRSVKRIDTEITVSQQSVSETNLLYEANVFKATLCFLLKVAQTRQGASQLLQCGLFAVIQDCALLRVDPDVGVGGSTSLYYELLTPIFQVVGAALLSMGADNEPVIAQVKRLLDVNHHLIVALLKREVVQSSLDAKLQELVKLLTLLLSLTEYVK